MLVISKPTWCLDEEFIIAVFILSYINASKQ